jgi:ribosomal protein L15
MTTINTKKLDQAIKDLKEIALVLKEKTRLFPALQKNTERILASIKMMEINISDVQDLEKNGDQE